MPSVAAAIELVPVPPSGRHFRGVATVRLGDVDPDGRLRLDAAARHLQDVANDDAIDSGLPNANGWVVRRTLLAVRCAPVLGERLSLTTFCSGTGRSWAERRTSVTGDRGGSIEAASVWVQIDPATGAVASLGPDFERIYGAAAAGRRVSTRLSLPGPPPDAEPRPWTVRAADLDVFGHVNNAVHWAVLEESLAVAADRRGVGEIEYPAPLDLAEPVTRLTYGHGSWLVSAGAVRTAACWKPAGPGHDHQPD